MPFLDLESLTEPLSEDQPCGESLEYDPKFVELETASRGKPEQQYGDNIIPAEPPEWTEVVKIGMGLAEKTRDLRIGCFLASGLLATKGIEAFVEALELVTVYIDRYWDSVHPQLDPDDDLDPAIRVNTLASLTSEHTTVRSLREAPLAEAGILGRFSLADIERARNHERAKPSEDDDDDSSGPKEEIPSIANIDATFKSMDAQALKDLYSCSKRLVELADGIEESLSKVVGSDQAISFIPLQSASNDIHKVLDEQIQKCGLNDPEPAEVDDSTEQVNAEGGTGASAPANMVQSQEIRSRDDVIRTLDRLCTYYRDYEPSSPLPLLLHRAKRLVPMGFLEIIADLSSDGFLQSQTVSDGSHETDGSDD